MSFLVSYIWHPETSRDFGVEKVIDNTNIVHVILGVISFHIIYVYQSWNYTPLFYESSDLFWTLYGVAIFYSKFLVPINVLSLTNEINLNSYTVLYITLTVYRKCTPTITEKKDWRKPIFGKKEVALYPKQKRSLQSKRIKNDDSLSSCLKFKEKNWTFMAIKLQGGVKRFIH